METLYLLQYASLIVMVILAVLLLISRIYLRWAHKQYEQSRWMVLLGMCMLGIHYSLQLVFDLRSLGDDVGAVINIFFYIPSLFLITMGIYNIESAGERRWTIVYTTCFSYVLSLVIFIVGYNLSKSVHIGRWLYILLVIFIMNMLYFAYITGLEVRGRKMVIEQKSYIDLKFYSRYVRISIGMLAFSAFVMFFSILSSSVLFVIGPLVLLVLIYFTVGFIAHGYNYVPTELLLERMNQTASEQPEKIEKPVKIEPVRPPKPVHVSTRSPLSEERVAFIDKALVGWSKTDGYKDVALNMMSLASILNIPKSDLSRFFTQQKNCSFRTWLSDIRFQAAKQMLANNPNYSHDIISAECGFASRSQLYRIFRQNVGMTPNEWKAFLAQSEQSSDNIPSQNEEA